MIPCQRCGTPLPAEARFCTACGLVRAPLSPGEASGAQQLPPGSGTLGAAGVPGFMVPPDAAPGATPAAPHIASAPAGPQSATPQVPSAPAGPQSAAPNAPSAPAGPQTPPGMPMHPPAGLTPQAPGLAMAQSPQGWPPQGPPLQHAAPPSGAPGWSPPSGAPGVQHPGLGQMPPGSAHLAQQMGHGAGQAAAHGASSAAAGHAVSGTASAFQHGASTLAPAAGVARKAGRFGLRQFGGLLKRSLAARIITAATVVTVAAGGAGAAYLIHANASANFVVATDRGNDAIDRIDLATRDKTMLISSKALQGAPDSIVFISDTQVLIDFASSDLGLGDIQSGAYTTVSRGHDNLRDMAVRPDGKGVLIADESGTLLEFHVSDHTVSTFAQSQDLGGVQGLAFDTDGNLYATVGSTVLQLDPGNGQKTKSFDLPGGSDGMAYDQHLKTLDIASGDQILALDPKTGKVKTLIDGISAADGVSVDRHGNLFIASGLGILELNTDNQLLIVGTNSNGVTWDDVAPLSGSGSANY